MGRLSEKFLSGSFVVTSELTPPKGTDVDTLLEKADLLAAAVDAINVTDSHGSKMSLSPIAAALLIADRGVEPILQMTTRDRNRIALQSDMLGAWVLGIENLICMGGDPPHLGDHPEAKPVFDIPTEELIRAALSLNKGNDLMSNSLRGKTACNVGAVVNPGADDLEIEIGAYFTFVMDDPSPVLGPFAQGFGLTEEQMRVHPHALFGSVDTICEELERRRELHGISYITIGKDNMEAFAPVVDRLNGK